MRIAVVGSGIAGLSCLHILGQRHEVHLFEAAERLGGHTHTHAIAVPGQAEPDQVDTGFIVFNPLNYPLFCRLLDELGVASRETTMSFSVSNPSDGLVYSGHDLAGLLAQKRNALRPRFWGLLRDIVRFNKLVPQCLDLDVDITLGDLLEQEAFGDWLARNYLTPMTAAIWSASTTRVLDMPMRFVARFLHNHRMDTVDDRPVWRTVAGGSQSYVRALTADHGGRIHVGRPVTAVQRHAGGVDLCSAGHPAESFDAVVLATHADQSLALLPDADETERAVLGAFTFASNEAVLHRDRQLLPARRRAWAAWNYHVFPDPGDRVAVTYSMNILQGLPEERPYLVSLNCAEHIDPALVLERMVYHHPQFSRDAVVAQDRHAEIDGRGGVHHCGAWWGFGFHEDGVASAVRVCRSLGVEW